MVTPDGICAHADAARETREWHETVTLKNYVAEVRSSRQPRFYLNLGEFDRILLWKLERQRGRQRALRSANTDRLVKAVTSLALGPRLVEDEDYDVEIRVAALCALRGVGVPVASAVISLAYPERYAVIDFRAWRQVFGEERRTFSVSNYKQYLYETRKLAADVHLPVQEVEFIIWDLDRQTE